MCATKTCCVLILFCYSYYDWLAIVGKALPDLYVIIAIKITRENTLHSCCFAVGVCLTDFTAIDHVVSQLTYCSRSMQSDAARAVSS